MSYNVNYNVSRTLSSNALAQLAMIAARNIRIAESKNDRSAVVHYSCVTQDIAQEMERRERIAKK